MKKLMLLIFSQLLTMTLCSQCDSFNGEIQTYCYGGNENSVFASYCADDAVNAFLRIHFTEGYIAYGDSLIIYEGPDDNGPILTSYSGQYVSGIVDLSNPLACLSFKMISGFNNDCQNPLGDPLPTQLVYEVSCICSKPEATFEFSSNNLCSQEAINFSENGLELDASNSQANEGQDILSYHWDFGDGSTSTETVPVVNHVYPESGQYNVSLSITDGLCESDLFIREIIVSGEPMVELQIPELVCANGIYPFSLEIEPFPIETDAVSFSSEVGEWPFGNVSSSLVSSIVIPENTNFTISNVDDFLVSIDIEHRYLGDVNLFLECPDGTLIAIQYFESLNSLSENLDGIYTFSMNASQTMVALADTLDEVNLPPGEYLPEEDFGGFVGCSVSGTWNLYIEDIFPLIDNGILYSWSLNFGENGFGLGVNENLVWSDEAFDPNGAYTAPSVPGIYSYSVFLQDAYGCEYQEDFDIEVTDGNSIDCDELCLNPEFLAKDSIVCLGSEFELGAAGSIMINADTSLQNVFSGFNNSGCPVYTNFNISLFPASEISFDPVILCAVNPVLNLQDYVLGNENGNWYVGENSVGAALNSSDWLQTDIGPDSKFYYEIIDSFNCNIGAVLSVVVADEIYVLDSIEACVDDLLLLADGTEWIVVKDTLLENIPLIMNGAECDTFQNLQIVLSEPIEVEVETVVLCSGSPEVYLGSVNIASPTGGNWYEGEDASGILLTGSDLNQTDINENTLYYYEVENDMACKFGAVLDFEIIDSVFTNSESTICMGDDFELPDGTILQVSSDTILENFYLGQNTVGCEIYETIEIEVFGEFDLELDTARLCYFYANLDLTDYDSGYPSSGLWYNGPDNTGEILSGEDLIQENVNSDSQFYYEYINFYGCKLGGVLNVVILDSTNCNLIIGLSATESTNKENCLKVKIYPSSSILQISHCEWTNYEVEIFNLQGQQVYESKNQDSQQHLISGFSLPSGLYVVSLSNGIERLAQKILIGE